jgi:hypothetical protein
MAVAAFTPATFRPSTTQETISWNKKQSRGNGDRQDPYEQGNVQLTVSFLRVEGVAVHLLDCDMDEHLNLINHGFEVIKHLFNGGTSPIAMHEYIVRDSAQNSPGVIATIDLGYILV